MNYIFWLNIVIAPGILFIIFLSLLYEGIERKVFARLQHRVGPPIWQGFYDFGKLIFKEDITPGAAYSFFFNLAPLLAVSTMILILLMIPIIGSKPLLGFAGNLVVILALFILPELSIILGGYASSNPYGAIGAGRSMMMLFSYEFPLVAATLVPAAFLGTLNLGEIVQYQQQSGWLVLKYPLATIAMLCVIPALTYKVPFDIPLATYEIHDGPLIEYSGPKLGLFLLTKDMEMLAITGLVVALFFGGPEPVHLGLLVIPGLVTFILKTLILMSLFSFIRATQARVKIEQALKFFWFVVGPVALVDLIRVLWTTIK